MEGGRSDFVMTLTTGNPNEQGRKRGRIEEEQDVVSMPTFPEKRKKRLLLEGKKEEQIKGDGE